MAEPKFWQDFNIKKKPCHKGIDRPRNAVIFVWKLIPILLVQSLTQG